MATYSMTCTCGYTSNVDAPSRDDAVRMIQGGMTAEFLAQHMREHHKADEPVPTVDQAHAMVAQLVQPAA
jgi:hypothetical protein